MDPKPTCTHTWEDGRRCSRGVWKAEPHNGKCIGHASSPAAVAVKNSAASAGRAAANNKSVRAQAKHRVAQVEAKKPLAPVVPIQATIPPDVDLDTVEGRQALRTLVIKNVVSGQWDPKSADIVLKALSDASREENPLVEDPAADTLLELQNQLLKRA